MPEIYTKDENGKLKSLGNIDKDRLNNELNRDDLSKYLTSFWTKEKCGKHNDLAQKHGQILMYTLIASPKDLFEQLNENIFTFQNFGPININSFLAKAKLDSYLKANYVDECMKVTVPRPAIGKGEFLLVSCFKNINFSSEVGDLVDTNGNKIEVKGSHSALGGDRGFKQMNKGIMFSIYRHFNTNPDYHDLTMNAAAELEALLKQNPDKIVPIMKLLENIDRESDTLSHQMAELFNKTGNLLHTIAASHLYAYMKLQKANFLFAINDSVFSGFEAPTSIENAYKLLQNFKINGWTTGNKGVTITLNKG